ncbi:secretory lipase [Herbihabitans rhizosphaerae]|uniref:Secretory lipase n=1 Tax=Herbihabitans rhizosphaerae TaxID=1872711 RepID=A0A4Q7L5C1_9PSEU|nr:lipase family protein [Herbihabitans rhizosphaerae]RZS44848.1 secretory lipase [Herbihabitans rhizosphaerae]
MRSIRAGVLAIVVALLAVLLGTPSASARPADQHSDQRPGEVQSVTPLPHDQWLPGTGDAKRVAYWSTGLGDRPTPVTGAVYLPQGAPPAGGWPVISRAHGTVGLGDACAPSTAFPNPDGNYEYLGKWLAQGYAIVTSDYAGIGTPGVHPYLDGKVAAYGVIDMVRAARTVVPTLSARWATLGNSQGGHTALFTANLATKYAPELDFRGAVAHGPPSNLAGLVSILGPSIPPSLLNPGMKSLITYILAGLHAARPDFDLASYLTPLGKQVVADAEVLCNDDMRERMEGIGLGELFTRQLGPEFEQAWGSIFNVPTSGYDRPIFIAQGTDDKTVFPFLTQQLVDDLAAHQQPYTYRTYPVDHMGALEAALPDTTQFLRQLFAPAAAQHR